MRGYSWRRGDVVQQLEALSARAGRSEAPPHDDRRLAEQIAQCEAFLRDMGVRSKTPVTTGRGVEDADRPGPEPPGLP